MKSRRGFLYVALACLAMAFILAGSVIVAQAASVTFTWTPPVLSCDGSDLHDLAGYAMLWGTNPGGPYPNQHSVDDPATTTVTIDVGQVESVTLYFVSVSIDSYGNRSDDIDGCGTSNEVSFPFGPVSPSPPTNLQGVVQ